MVVMDIAAAQITFGMVGKVDRIDIVTDEQRPSTMWHGVYGLFCRPMSSVERPANRTRQVEQMVRAFRLNLTVLSWVGLLVGMFLIYNTMAFAVAQRRREIGIYRAIGMTQSRVAGLFLIGSGVLWSLRRNRRKRSRSGTRSRACGATQSNDFRSLRSSRCRRRRAILDRPILEHDARRHCDWVRGVHDRRRRPKPGCQPHGDRPGVGSW